jgi:exodeoxyribonuclease-3
VLKIATYNLNGIRSRLPRLLEWLEREKPDVVCLQELKSVDSAFPKKDIESAGYGAAWIGQSSWNGVAVLTRDTEPIEIRRTLPGGLLDKQSRYLEVAAHGILVACLYLPNGNPQPGPKFDYKLEWFERLITHAVTLFGCGSPVVLAGDFNVVPTDFDIYDPKHWRKNALLQPASRDCFARLLSQGWLDAIRHQFPDEPVYTFWDFFREHWKRNAGLRIDHLLLNRTLAPRLHDAGVDRWVRDRPGASDHAPTWIELSDKSARTTKSRKPKIEKPKKLTERASSLATKKTRAR